MECGGQRIKIARSILRTIAVKLVRRVSVFDEQEFSILLVTGSTEFRGGAKIDQRHVAVRAKETDIGRLSQVFINLIRNAEKYCDAENPRLAIRARQSEGLLHVDFIDNGTGIAKAERDVIFEKFSRLTAQQRAGGAGRGLAAALGDCVTLHAFDLPNHGKSGDWDGTGDMHDTASAMARTVLDDVGDAPIDVIGHSFGATVALRLAVEMPARLRRAALFEPVFFAPAFADNPGRSCRSC